MATFDGLNQSFAQRLQSLMDAAPKQVGLISGFRSHEQQQALWDQSSKDGKMVAKPGSSHHESGTAADLSFADDTTRQWVHDNAARFGLFFPMSWEPWHIEPMGTNGDAGLTEPPAGVTPVDKASGYFDIILGNRSAPSVQDMAATAAGQNADPAAATAPGASGAPSTGPIGYQQVYDLAVKQGASPEEATFLASVAQPESGYDPQAHNTNAATGDNSYGLLQINMLGNMGASRQKAWGLSSYDDLFDPATNVRAGLELLRSQGKNAWRNSLPKMKVF